MSISVLHIFIAMLSCIPSLHICIAYLCSISVLHIFLAYLSCKSVLHICIAYLYCIALLHIFIAYWLFVVCSRSLVVCSRSLVVFAVACCLFAVACLCCFRGRSVLLLFHQKMLKSHLFYCILA